MKFDIKIILAFLFICFIAFVTCHKNSTEPKTGTLTGTVLLEGEQDHSGITVAFRVCNTLYEHFKIDQLFKY